MGLPEAPRIGALVLCAGESRRMGRPKALLPLQGRTFLETLCSRLASAGVDPVVVVLGAAADQIRGAVSLPTVRFVVNPDPARGQLSSILCGLEAVATDDLDGVFIAPVDTPRVRPASLRRMIDALRSSPLVVPTYAGRRGHPALFAARLFESIRRAPAAEGARAVVHAQADRLELDCGDPAVLEDFDKPDDLPRPTQG
jgi:CTP:molybdopterin cytidylyltransferase MocA